MLGRKANLPLEVAILLVAASTMLTAGSWLFPVAAGRLPFHEDGLYGLLLIIFALQMITLGKTPFADVRRPRLLLVLGVAVSATGMLSCILPGALGALPRMLLILCLGPGGLALLLQMLLDPGKAARWLRCESLVRALVPSCAAVYAGSMLVAVLLAAQKSRQTPFTAVAFLSHGTAIVWLAWVLYRIYQAGLAEEKPARGEVVLSTEHAMLLLTGVFMVVLGLVLVPVSLGLLAFSGSAQLGLLMVIFAVQMMTTGSTPIGPFVRSWPLVVLGLLFAAVGVLSCLIPGLLVSQLTVLVGTLNLLGGAGGLIFRSPAPARIAAAQLTLNVLTIVFGASMLVAHLLPSLLIGLILALNGCVLLYLLKALVELSPDADGLSTAFEHDETKSKAAAGLGG